MKLNHIDRDLHLLHYQGQTNTAAAEDPLRIGIITSIRDVGASDQNGRLIETSTGVSRIKGIPEALYEASRDFASS